MRDGCPHQGCSEPGLSPHRHHSGSTTDWYEREARGERFQERREKVGRFGDPVGSTCKADHVENLRPSLDLDGKRLGMEGDCPGCGERVGLTGAELKGRREAFCLRCGWTGRFDYREVWSEQ